MLMTTMEEDDPHLEKLPVDFEQVGMSVEPNDRFSLIDDKAWANTLAPKRGFVRVGPEGRAFAISLYHQLHCVNAIRFSYTVARDGLVTDPEILKNKIGHDNHCFQFLRQSILCKADNALVPIQTNRNASLASMGFGNTHRCRNWEQVRQFVFDNVAEWKNVPLFNGTSGMHVGSNSRL
jgi:Mycotoxin biosynthesis protein UstYa